MAGTEAAPGEVLGDGRQGRRVAKGTSGKRFTCITGGELEGRAVAAQDTVYEHADRAHSHCTRAQTP